MTVKLYELATQFENLMLAIDAADGEIDAEFEAHLEQLEGDLKTKVEGCLQVARSFELEAEAVKTEEERLSKRRKALENKRQRLRDYVRDNLIRMGQKKLRTGHFSVSIQDARLSLVIDDVKKLPKDFVKMEPVVDQSRLKSALIEQSIPGAHLKEGDPILVVR